MNKTLLILIFSNFLHAELILEITQGTDNPYRVALVQFEGNENISKDINPFKASDLPFYLKRAVNSCLLYTSPSPRDS